MWGGCTSGSAAELTASCCRCPFKGWACVVSWCSALMTAACFECSLGILVYQSTIVTGSEQASNTLVSHYRRSRSLVAFQAVASSLTRHRLSVHAVLMQRIAADCWLVCWLKRSCSHQGFSNPSG
jgi:hypothetical protein